MESSENDTGGIKLGTLCGHPPQAPVEVAEISLQEFLLRVHEDLLENGERATLRHSFSMRQGEQRYWISVVESYHLRPSGAWARLLCTVRKLPGDHAFTRRAFEVFRRIPEITCDILEVLE